MDTRSIRRAILALLVVTIIWGWTFSWMKEAIETAEAVIPNALVFIIGLFMTLRFAIASLVMPLVLKGARKNIGTRKVWSDGGILAAFLLGGFLLQMFGLEGVGPAVSAFLTSLYVAFTALIAGVVNREWPSKVAIAGVIIVTFGAATISGPPQLTFGISEWLTVLCALLFAGHIFFTDRITKRSPPLSVALTSFIWVTLGSMILLGLGVFLRPDLDWAITVRLLQTPGFIRPVLLSGLLGTLVALSLLTNFQRFLSPVRAAILFSLEPVWAAIIAVSVGQTQIDGWLLFGGGALLMGNLWMEIWPRTRFGKGAAA
jgi:drug/metabolite transporter (DMT)-like permease